MKKNAEEKIKLIITQKENEAKASQQNNAVPVQVEEIPLGDVLEQEAIEDEEHICYMLRRRPGESPGVELWFRDNSVQVLSYGYFKRAVLSKTQTTMLLLFTDGNVKLRGRGLVNLITPINDRKINRLIEQHKDLDNGVDESVFISEMVAEVEEMEGLE